MRDKFKLGVTLFTIGLLGVLTLLQLNFPIEKLSKAALDRFSIQELKILMLVNPSILLLIAVLTGVNLSRKVELGAPLIEKLLKIKNTTIIFKEQLKIGVIIGSSIGILTSFITLLFKSFFSLNFHKLTSEIEPPFLMKIGYGGITEELLIRYGFMTFIVWVIFKTSKKLNDYTYWFGIILSSIFFAIGHFPIVFSSVHNPSTSLLIYIFSGNFIAGLTFGWLYWKKGLEAAFIGHIFAHIIMTALAFFFHL